MLRIFDIEGNAFFSIVGSCDVQINDAKFFTVQSEELISVANETDCKNISLKNKHDESISVLVISIAHLNSGLDDKTELKKITFKGKNEFSSIENLDCLTIGVFDSRTKGTYKQTATTENILLYTINGTFEVENRLLNQRDCLLLKNKSEIEFEALTEFAILLIIQLPNQ